MGSEGRALQDQVNGFAGRVEVIEGPSGFQRTSDSSSLKGSPFLPKRYYIRGCNVHKRPTHLAIPGTL